MCKFLSKILVCFVAILVLGMDFDRGRPPIEVGDFAPNTAGKMITYDSSGNPTSCGPGTVNQYFASQGAGAEPIFKSILDEDDMVSDSATDVASQQSIKKYVDDNATATKEFFVKAGNQSGVGTVDDWIFISKDSSGSVAFAFIVPNDFSSLVAAVVVILPDATETVQWDNDTSVAAVGEAYNADTRQSLDETKAVTANELTELDVSATFTGLSAGDLVAHRFQSDTTTLRILGLRIRY